MVKFLLIILGIPLLMVAVCVLIVAVSIRYLLKKTGILKTLSHSQTQYSPRKINEKNTSKETNSAELLEPCPHCGVYVRRADFDMHQASHR
ncbi:MAG: hypothetical protein RL344_474 [Pseudomonadota bacterium]|jgi:type IV secretory pathway VirB6-like protein